MSTFTNFAVRHEYTAVAAMGDWLDETSGQIDWDAFRSLLADLFANAEGREGHPSYDAILMVEILVLQR